MVKHWLTHRHTEPKWFKKFIINFIGLILCVFILISTLIIKFGEGGWVTIIITGLLVFFSALIKSRYNKIATMIKELDVLSIEAEKEINNAKNIVTQEYIKDAKTAVIFVHGFNGLGLHTLLNIIRCFGMDFRNFVFINIGIIDYGNFKGMDEIKKLEEKISNDLDKYILYVNKNRLFGEKFYSMGTDIVEEVENILPKVIEKYPNSVFFGGKLVFKNESLYSNLLFNNFIFELQRIIYQHCRPFVMMPATLYDRSSREKAIVPKITKKPVEPEHQPVSSSQI
jgi:hypothetical protein